MLNSFPWANCHGKADNMVKEGKSDTRCMETPVDFEHPLTTGRFYRAVDPILCIAGPFLPNIKHFPEL
jgi:hypothetical protein